MFVTCVVQYVWPNKNKQFHQQQNIYTVNMLGVIRKVNKKLVNLNLCKMHLEYKRNTINQSVLWFYQFYFNRHFWVCIFTKQIVRHLKVICFVFVFNISQNT